VHPIVRLRRLVPLPALLVLGLLAAACGGSAETSVAATVGDTEITVAEVDEAYEQRAAASGVASELAGDESGTVEENLKIGVLTNLIRSEVLRRAAEDQGVEVTDEDVASQREELLSEVGGQEALDELLAQNNVSEEELESNLRDQAITDAIAARLADDVSDEEVEQAFEDDAQNQYGEKVEVRHILTETRAQARDAIERIESGESFADVAQDVSIDTASAQNGGELGEIPEGATVPEFEEAAFGAEPGEIVGPVKSQFGFHVIEVTDRVAAPELSDVSGQIRDDLETAAGGEAFTAYINEFVAGLDISVDEQYGTWDDATVSVVPPGAGSEPAVAPSGAAVPTELPTDLPTAAPTG
jgi:parvulin-like peptidyl-prolyl isomerase